MNIQRSPSNLKTGVLYAKAFLIILIALNFNVIPFLAPNSSSISENSNSNINADIWLWNFSAIVLSNYFRLEVGLCLLENSNKSVGKCLECKWDTINLFNPSMEPSNLWNVYPSSSTSPKVAN